MANEKLRETAQKKGVNLWQLADRFGVADTTFARWMRHEFEPERKQKALQFIEEIAAERRGGC